MESSLATATQPQRLRPPPTFPTGSRVAITGPLSQNTLLECLKNTPTLQRIWVLDPQPNPRMACLDPRIQTIPFDQPDRLVAQFEQSPLLFAEGRVGLHLDTLPAALQDTAYACVMDFTRRIISSTALRNTRGWHMLSNMQLNARQSFGSAAVLKGAAHGSPVIIVGAGPSLDCNVQSLHQKPKHIPIIACDGALNTLLQAGIQPDLVVSSDDSEKLWRHLAQAATLKVPPPMLAYPQSSWPLLRHYPGAILLASTGSDIERAALQANPLPIIAPGQCVGHTALALARYMEAAPIIMVGFDLAYRGDRFHPVDMALPYFHLDPPPPENRVSVPGIDGQPVITDISMHLYLRGFEQRIAESPVPVWDATEGGACIRGTRIIALADALRELKPSSPAPRAPQCAPFSPSRLQFRATSAQIQKALETTEQALETPPAKLIKNPALLQFLEAGDPAIQAVAPIINPALLADFIFSWQDVHRHHSAKLVSHLEQVIKQYCLEVRTTLQLLAALDEGTSHRDFLNDQRIIALSSIPRDLVTRLTGHTDLETFYGEPDDIPAFWKQTAFLRAGTVINLDGALFPAAWAMPGCCCLDIRTQAPSQHVLREHWLPGYGVLALQPDIAEAWRAFVPPDRPVFLLDRYQPILWEVATNKACQHPFDVYHTLFQERTPAPREQLPTDLFGNHERILL